MSVCVDLCLLGFEPYRELVRLVSVVVLLFYFLYVGLLFLAFYSKFVTTFPTGSAGRNLTYRFNPVSVVISNFTRNLLRLIRLVFLASLLLPLLTL